MPRTPELLHIWQDAIPKMAFKSSHLMYQVLAVSAFHKAHLAPSEREHWVLRALGFHGRTTEDLRLATRELTEESCHSIFATASLLVINSFASYSCQSPGSAIEDLLDIFELTRGMNGILKMYESSLWSGPLARQFHPSDQPRDSAELGDVMHDLAKMAASPSNVVGSDPACRQAAESLTYAIERAMLTSSAPHLRVVFYWPIALSDEFMRLLKQKEPSAFVVLWYYARVLSLGEPNVWFLSGWGESLLRDAQHLTHDAVGTLN
ncbi:hypothetical protein PFICI_00801 [Pestalotiopsis fici W106-1]|uniref:Uncharacterized protein n=1 Tax=Pestalotiopsis fici (strain W106-1 / CGMCC3.15140) TaxID=1229662 RepID=W3XLN2_PESFW|nr:uncharacterized protein PFICI_00801 [Pestalotiopsis fici W106-1]ETS86973.1 hypothetical protein PFICI_00801 [Pestalotiopsis fici W106-1]